MVKFSTNWKKQKAKISRLHSHIASIRRDYLHKVTTTISKKHAMIVIEDLKVSSMSKSAAGTVDKPGSNVAAKSGLNRAILEQSWYEMRRQLEYKQRWHGGEVQAVNPAYTSQKCARCGHSAKENRQSQAVFVCGACGFEANAGINGARNILASGHAVLSGVTRDAPVRRRKQLSVEPGNAATCCYLKRNPPPDSRSEKVGENVKSSAPP